MFGGRQGGRVRARRAELVTANLQTDMTELTHDELRERMSGNLCRCGAHNGIVDAIRETFARDVAEHREQEAAR